jgi:hypothetical protein
MILLGLAAVVIVAAVLIATLGGSDDKKKKAATTAAPRPATATTGTPPPPPAPVSNTIVVRDAKPVGGVQKLKYDKGDTVDIVVKSDTADEIHLHGYDLMKDVAAGGRVRFRFKATIEGVFEIELEGRKQQIASLDVGS